MSCFGQRTARRMAEDERLGLRQAVIDLHEPGQILQLGFWTPASCMICGPPGSARLGFYVAPTSISSAYEFKATIVQRRKLAA